MADNEQAKQTGDWVQASLTTPRVGPSYLHDDNANKGKASVRFELAIPTAGKYDVRLAWPTNPNRATNVPVRIESAMGQHTVKVNQREGRSKDDTFQSVGSFTFEDKAVIVISNDETDGYVIVDAVQLLPVK